MKDVHKWRKTQGKREREGEKKNQNIPLYRSLLFNCSLSPSLPRSHLGWAPSPREAFQKASQNAI